jgi:hypothetical protein
LEKAVDSSDAKPVKPLDLPRKIFNIGKLGEALKEKLKRRLVAVQRDFAGDYIYFEGVFDDGVTAGSDGAPDALAREGLFDFFRERELLPFIRLDLSRAPHDADGRLKTDESLLMLKTFMEALVTSQPQEYWEGSLFEIAHSKAIDNTCFMECYARIYSLLKSFSPRTGVGLYSFDRSNRGNYDALEERLILCGKGRCDPDFVTIDVNPAIDFEMGTRTGRSDEIEKVWHVINDSGAAAMEMYVIERKDPRGSARLESDVSGRIASMVLSLPEYGDKISGAVFWLNGE